MRSETLGFGKTGDIAISTKQVIIKNGGQINNLTFGAATSGNINVQASDSIQLVGVSPFDPAVFSTISTATFNSGDADNITVSTRQFVARDGGNLSSSTFGTGRGADVTVSATNSVEIIGASPITFQPSLLSSISLSAGKAGSLTISTSKLIVRDGGRVDASTLASGEGGNVTINALKSIEISEKIPGSGEPSLVISSANIVSPTLQKLYRLPPAPSAKSGNVTINTGQLSLTDDAEVNVRNDGSNDAGTLEINATSVSLDNKSVITATTVSGEGGNIFLNVPYLQLSNNSAVTATAGNKGNGGNININTDILTAWGNSSITADAFEGRGGNITINAQGLFFSPDSLITASSKYGINGTVKYNIVDPNISPTQLKPKVIPIAPQITPVCQARAGTEVSSFRVSSTRNLQSKPNDLMHNNIEQSNSLTVPAFNNSHNPKSLTSNQPTQIIEANVLIRDSQRNLVLTTDQANPTWDNASLSASSCFSGSQ
ncbi:hypothetical protein [uncultured Nostoc sp.]|uniref:hypothetical protein n=1 Tax=uncultured Nostoc sp. TaxID=340711 RepID=UPI0035CBE8ED